MTKTLLELAIALGAAAALTACSVNQVANTIAAVQGGLSGTIYATAAQTALVAQGAGNIVASGAGNVSGGYFILGVRSDEVGQANVAVQVLLKGSAFTVAQTDSTGHFSVTATSGVTYQVTGTIPRQSGGSVVVNGFAQVDPTATLELGAAHNLLSSKLLSMGVNYPDWTVFKGVLAKMNSELSSVATTPAPTDQSSAAAAFDAIASTDLKAAVAAMRNIQGN